MECVIIFVICCQGWLEFVQIKNFGFSIKNVRVFFLSLSAFFVITSFIVLGSNIFLLGRCNSDFWKMSCMILFSLFPWFMILIALMCAISISTDSSVKFSFVYMALRILLYSFSLCVCSIPKYSLSSFLLLSIWFFFNF